MVVYTVIGKPNTRKLLVIFSKRCGDFKIAVKMNLRLSLVFKEKYFSYLRIDFRVYCDVALAKKLSRSDVYFRMR